MNSVNTRSVALPLILAMVLTQLLLAPVGRPMLIGLQLVMMLWVAVLYFKGRAKIYVFFVFGWWLSISIFNYMNLDMAVSPDAIKYRDYYYEFRGDPGRFFLSVYNEAKASKYYDVSSYSVVGAIFYPVSYLFDETDIGSVFLILNLLFALGAALLYGGAIDKLSSKYNTQKKIAFFLWIFSPVVIYHYQVFSKDILSCFLCAVSVYFFSGKKLLSGVFFLVLATMLRPYSIAIVFSIYFFLSDDTNRLLQGSVASLIVVIFMAGFEGVVNSILVLLYMPISPNFFGFSIERNDYIPLYFESFLFFLGIQVLLISLFYSKSARDFCKHCLLALFVYACVMTVLGKYSADHYDTAYQVGTMGNNALRKKIPILPIYLSMIFVSFSFFRTRNFKK